MRVISNRLVVYSAVVFCFVAATLILIVTFWENPEAKEFHRVASIQRVREILSQKLAPYFVKSEFIPQVELEWDGSPQEVELEYTLNHELQEEANRLLKAYKPDYGAVVVMNTATGQVLAMASYQRTGEKTENLALKGTFPAASVFKIVTASAAVDKYSLSPDTIVLFNGSNHTLYKKNVMQTKRNRWTREMTLREAFARSVNTFFGRLTFEKLTPQDLNEYAGRFGFNRTIASDLPFDAGFTDVPKEQSFALAEIASGYNRITRMSPLQGAMIAASIAEDGVMRVPYVVERVKSKEDGKILFQAEPITAAITMSPQGADKLRELMKATVKSGTSRKSFGPLVKDRRFKELEVGGKTGSLYGDNPRGKTDWFVGYAIGSQDKLAVAAITVNVDYWTVKASHLAQSLFKTHFKEEYSQGRKPAKQ